MLDVISVLRLLLTVKRSALRVVMLDVISVLRLLLTVKRSALRVVMLEVISVLRLLFTVERSVSRDWISVSAVARRVSALLSTDPKSMFVSCEPSPRKFVAIILAVATTLP